MDDEAVWKQRFLIFAAARMIGLIVFLLGIAIAFSDVARVGGWPELGGIIAVLGALDAVFVPRILKKQWDRQ